MSTAQKFKYRISVVSAFFLVALLSLVSCGGGSSGGGTSTGSGTYTVSGAVSGISVSGLKLTNNGGDEITVNTAGTFAFTAPLANNSAYSVAVSQNPTAPAQTCTLTNNTGSISSANITNVSVVCSVLTLSIQSISSTGPGQQPSVTFQVKANGTPVDIMTAPIASLKATIAGPTTDYANYWQATIQGSVITGTLAPVDAPNGIFRYTFSAPEAIPVPATGSYVIGLEGYVQDVALVKFSAVSPLLPFIVTDATPVARRAVVDDAKCNACHATIAAHKGTRRGVQYCALCHNPNESNDTQVARFEGATIVSNSMDMKVLIHKIHRGAALTQPYIVGGTPAPTTTNPSGTPIDFRTAVSYPGDLRACKACHLPNTYNIPLAQGLLPSTEKLFTCTEDPAADTDSYCITRVVTTSTLTQPIAAACTSCHDATYTAAHAATMTTSGFIESCPTCHAVGATNGIDVYHKLTP
ncbi:MAG: hypothetical protein ABI479_12645 [Gallionella sp.]